MKPKVSIILPIYNVEPYLHKCVDSIGLLGQEGVEIILVNDGSTDGSHSICAEYAERWSNVIVINKSNGGLSDARNWGTEVAQGDYIYYLDSDDWLEPGAIETLYCFAKDNKCEVVQGGFYYSFDDHLEYDDRWIKDNDKPFVLGREDAMKQLIKNQYVKNFAWGKLYKSDIAKKHRFPIGKYFEDSYWQHLIIHETTQYGVIPAPLYYYRQRNDSISGKSGKKILDLFLGHEKQLSFLLDYYPVLANSLADKLWKESYSYRNYDMDFNRFFNNVNVQYTRLLSKSFKKSLFYNLAIRESSFLSYYMIYLKVKDWLCGKRLQRIELNNSNGMD